MKRIAQTIRLRPDRRKDYFALHAAVWPAVEAALHRAHVRSYSIFRHHDVPPVLAFSALTLTPACDETADPVVHAF
ncbi:L-rhamnose mutarotase [Streptomyces sp. NBC_00696]|uniref:L-rhamnose mutarotase n=1 Tax=Streptomyces sp. NBC_00696 TaxID=2903672 RepID=UPI003FA7CF02